MPNIDIIMVMVVLVIAMALFFWGRLRYDLVAVCVLVALLVLGLIDVSQALYGFANQATVTIAAMFVLSAGLVRTGAVRWLTQRINDLAGKKEWRLILVLSVVVAALSAFVVNTATVAIFIPIAVLLAKKRKISVSRVLIPLSFASQFGGVSTLIGTSTNLVINSIAMDRGLGAFGLFEFAPLGIVMSLAGIIYLTVVSRWLLPKRRGEVEQVDKYRLADYLAELKVLEDSPLIGKTWARSKASRETKVDLVNFLRGDKATAKPSHTVIREGDVLLLHGQLNDIIELEDKYRLKVVANARISDQKLKSVELQLIEVLIPPNSRLVGQTLNTSDFFRRYDVRALAIQRRGRALKQSVWDIQLTDGDTLLIQGHKDDVSRLLNSPNVIVTNELSELHVRTNRVTIALGALGLLVALAALNLVPIMVAALIGALIMVLGRCLTIEEAYQAINWKVIFLLGGMIPLGIALEQSGAAIWLANSLLQPIVGFGPLLVLAVVYLITAVLTEAISNNAAAVILAPIAISVAVSMNVDPRPFLIAITFAASTSFATPIGYQTNTMVYAPGGYRFSDFTRVGIPLNLIFWGLAVLLIPMLWPM